MTLKTNHHRYAIFPLAAKNFVGSNERLFQYLWLD